MLGIDPIQSLLRPPRAEQAKKAPPAGAVSFGPLPSSQDRPAIRDGGPDQRLHAAQPCDCRAQLRGGQEAAQIVKIQRLGPGGGYEKSSQKVVARRRPRAQQMSRNCGPQQQLQSCVCGSKLQGGGGATATRDATGLGGGGDGRASPESERASLNAAPKGGGSSNRQATKALALTFWGALNRNSINTHRRQHRPDWTEREAYVHTKDTDLAGYVACLLRRNEQSSKQAGRQKARIDQMDWFCVFCFPKARPGPFSLLFYTNASYSKSHSSTVMSTSSSHVW